jgi:tetraacyldisaccharide 4'-kinase
MREPSFWWHEPTPAWASLLAPLSQVYGTIAARRMARPGERVAVPVICVGNLTVGGAGKTPTALAIASMLRQSGLAPAFLTRGYGGRLAGPVRVERTNDSADVGDEPLLLARAFPTIVAGDRPAGAIIAVAAGANVIVMDDGFQNPSLTKDFSLIVVDGWRGVGNGRVLPAGPLRAPIEAQLQHTDVLLVVGPRSGAAAPVIDAARSHGIPVLMARLMPDPATLALIVGRKVLAFAGIGDPEKFFETLREAGVVVAATRSFEDHHRYTAEEAEDLLAQAQQERLMLVTTEKDYVRLTGGGALADLARQTDALPVRLAFEDPSTMRMLLTGAVGRIRPI